MNSKDNLKLCSTIDHFLTFPAANKSDRSSFSIYTFLPPCISTENLSAHLQQMKSRASLLEETTEGLRDVMPTLE